MIGSVFKIFGTIMSGAGTMMAGGALLTSTALLNAQSSDEDDELMEQKIKMTRRKLKNISGKYKIVDIENDLNILTSTDDLKEARAWLCEYRTNGYKVMLQVK